MIKIKLDMKGLEDYLKQIELKLDKLIGISRDGEIEDISEVREKLGMTESRFKIRTHSEPLYKTIDEAKEISDARKQNDNNLEKNLKEQELLARDMEDWLSE